MSLNAPFVLNVPDKNFVIFSAENVNNAQGLQMGAPKSRDAEMEFAELNAQIRKNALQ